MLDGTEMFLDRCIKRERERERHPERQRVIERDKATDSVIEMLNFIKVR